MFFEKRIKGNPEDFAIWAQGVSEGSFWIIETGRNNPDEQFWIVRERPNNPKRVVLYFSDWEWQPYIPPAIASNDYLFPAISKEELGKITVTAGPENDAWLTIEALDSAWAEHGLKESWGALYSKMQKHGWIIETMEKNFQVYLNHDIETIIDKLPQQWEHNHLTFVKSVKYNWKYKNEIVFYRCGEIFGIAGEIVIDLRPDGQNTMVHITGDEFYGRRFCEDLSRWNYKHLPPPAETAQQARPPGPVQAEKAPGAGAPGQTANGGTISKWEYLMENSPKGMDFKKKWDRLPSQAKDDPWNKETYERIAEYLDGTKALTAVEWKGHISVNYSFIYRRCKDELGLSPKEAREILHKK